MDDARNNLPFNSDREVLMKPIPSDGTGNRFGTLLLIDPDLDNREIAATTLRLAGFDVILAATPYEGIRLARFKQPAVIVTELFRRTERGWFILETLKRYPSTKDIPVLAYTSYAMPADARAAIESGADTFAAKPMDPNELPDIVAALLASRA
jgi:two-component system, cell cycle response regulator DivK